MPQLTNTAVKAIADAAAGMGEPVEAVKAFYLSLPLRRLGASMDGRRIEPMDCDAVGGQARDVIAEMMGNTRPRGQKYSIRQRDVDSAAFQVSGYGSAT